MVLEERPNIYRSIEKMGWPIRTGPAEIAKIEVLHKYNGLISSVKYRNLNLVGRIIFCLR